MRYASNFPAHDILRPCNQAAVLALMSVSLVLLLLVNSARSPVYYMPRQLHPVVRSIPPESGQRLHSLFCLAVVGLGLGLPLVSNSVLATGGGLMSGGLAEMVSCW